jgi:RTX calcium-binding nonapeptide repeat (4 copies)
MRLRFGIAVAAVLVLGSSSVGVAVAAPGDDTTVEATATTVPANGMGGTFVVCPSDSFVTGGGIGYAGYSPGSLAMQIARSTPSRNSTVPTMEDGATTNRWSTLMWNLSPLLLEPTAFALCSANSDAVIEAQAFDVPGARSVGAAATCPAGTRVLGGGTGQSTAQIVVELSGPLDETGLTDNTADGDVARSWYTYVYNGTGITASFKVFALCSAKSDAIVEATEFNVPAASSDIATATCPAGRRAVGGGINTTGPALNGGSLGYRAIMTHPVDETGGIANTQDGDAARGWRSAIWNQSGSIRSFKTMALCARDPSDDGGPGPGPNPGPGPGPAPGPGGRKPRCGGKRATLVGTSGRDRLRGTRRADVIVGLGGNDVIRAGRGNDLVCAGAGNDYVDGGAGNDRLSGGSGGDRLLGGAGRDRLTGDSGRDRCVGGAGRDQAACERKG